MNAQELYFSHGISAEIWCCDKCSTTFTDRNQAEKCCTMDYKNKPKNCYIEFNKFTKYVGEEIQKRSPEFDRKCFNLNDKDWLVMIADRYITWVAANLKECSEKHLAINSNIIK